MRRRKAMRRFGLSFGTSLMRLFGVHCESFLLAPTAVAYVLLVALSSIVGSALPAQAQRLALETAVYRFKVTPDYLSLSLIGDSVLLGKTASMLHKSRWTVLGSIIEKNKIELGIYDVDSELYVKTLAHPTCENPPGVYFYVSPKCWDYYLEQIRNQPKKAPLRQYEFHSNVFEPGGGTWRASSDTSSAYSSFNYSQDKGFGSLEARLRGVSSKQVDVYIGAAAPPARMFEGERNWIAGTGTAAFAFPKFPCQATHAKLKRALKRAGNWDVDVTPVTYERGFNIELASHSDKEFYYYSGYWWQAFLEVFFQEEDGSGQCSKGSLRLYDSTVCSRPVGRKPEPTCFERPPYGSRSEYDLRDRLTRALVKEFGLIE